MATDLQLGTGDSVAVVGVGAGRVPSGWVGRRLLVAVLVVVNGPIVVATVRALARGWLPLGDNGILLVRARDVGTSHHPLLGSWTSASLVVGENLNNPGPVYFDLLAPWVRLLGPWVGLAVGVMLVNMAAASLAVVAARRLCGVESMLAVAVVVVGLQFAMGSELLFDVWQPNALVLPFLAFLVVVTVLATGDLVMAPWVVGVGSLLVQTHMSHAVLVGVLSLAGLGGCVLAVRRRGEPVAWRRPLVWSGVVAVVAWCQPVIEQFTGRGDGNLSRIWAASSGGDASTIGWERALRLVGEVLGGAPWFTRSSYDTAVPSIFDGTGTVETVMSPDAAVVVVALVVGLLAAVAAWAWRTDRPQLAVMLAMAGIALVTAVAALAMSPVNAVGISPHQMRWLWPIAAFVSAALLAAVFVAARDRPWAHVPARGVALGVIAVAALVIPVLHRTPGIGPTRDARSLSAARELVSGFQVLEGRGTVFFDPSTLSFAEPYSGLVFAELQDHGIPFVFDDEGFIRQFGEGRRDDGTADLRLWLAEGAAALEVPAGAERVGRAEGPSGPVALFVAPIG